MQTPISFLAGEKFLAERRVEQPKWQRVVLLFVLGYEGAGALSGGSLLVAAPDGRLMDMPVDMMHGTFPDFLIPGILLLALGVLNAAAFFAILRRKRYGWLLTVLSLGGLAIWFWIEIAILQALHWLHAMWGLPVIAGLLATIPLIPGNRETVRKVALTGGILSSLLYLIINIIVPTQWDAYDVASQTVSELSAIGAPTRILWEVLVTPYTLLILAFAWGVWTSAGDNHRLRMAGKLLLAYGALGILWPLAPMHLRETLAAGGATFSDTLHIALGVVTEILYLAALALAATALGKTFRIYSIITFILVLVFGVLTFLEAPGISSNQPTPLIGVWERINIGLFLLWAVALAVVLMRSQNKEEQLDKKKPVEVTTLKLKGSLPGNIRKHH